MINRITSEYACKIWGCRVAARHPFPFCTGMMPGRTWILHGFDMDVKRAEKETELEREMCQDRKWLNIY